MSCGVPSVFPLGLLEAGSAPERRRQQRKFPPSLRKETPNLQGWMGRPNTEPRLFSWDGCPTHPTPASSQLPRAHTPGYAGRSPDAGRGPEGVLTSCFMAGSPPCPPEGPSEHIVGRTLPWPETSASLGLRSALLPTGWPVTGTGDQQRLATQALGRQRPCEAREVTAGNRKGLRP